MIVLVTVEMIAQVVDPLRKEGDLNGSAATIGVVQLVLLNDFFFGTHRVEVPP